MKIEIWTDGSSINNGKPECVGGWSAIFFLNGKQYIRYGQLKAPSSNNRAEIYGVLFAIQTLKANKHWEISVFSDSQYVVKSVMEWRHKWKRNNYDGVKNSDLLIPLFNAVDEHGNVTLKWVKGHAGTAGNELADLWAGRGGRGEVAEYKNLTNDIKMIEEVKYGY